jgi:mycobactin lysine-N-oxygenase
MTKIAVVGAGAKAAAIAARASTLREIGVSGVSEILVFEAEHIGAAWSGRGGFSSGFLTLCTPGEKDVGFPYNEVSPRGIAKSPIAPALFARFSWPAYLVAEGAMSEWVNRGRDHPTHRNWAAYLEWVFASAKQPVISAKVTTVRHTRSGWEVTFIKEGRSEIWLGRVLI